MCELTSVTKSHIEKEKEDENTDISCSSLLIKTKILTNIQ